MEVRSKTLPTQWPPVGIRNVLVCHLFFISDYPALCNIFVALICDTPLGSHFLCAHVCFLHFKLNTILTTLSFSCQDNLNLMAECEIRLPIRESGVQWFDPLIICFVNRAMHPDFFFLIELESGERIHFMNSVQQSDFPASC